MLLIWTKDPAARVMKAIGSKFKQYPDLQVEVCNNFAYLPDRPNLKAVLAMGAEPVTYLQNMKVLPKNRTISSLRNSAVHVEGLSAPVLVTYSSGIGDIDYGKYIDQLCDAQLAVRLHETGDLSPVIGKYAYASHFTELLADVRAQFKETGKPVDVALDLETVGFDPYREPAEDGSHPGGYIVTIQASSREGTGHTIYFESRAELAERLNADLEFVVQLHELLTSPMISLRGANLKFDLNWLWVHTGIQCENFKFDTTLVGSLLDENRSNSLSMHAKVYTTMGGYDDAFNASIDKGRMDLIDKDILLPYANGDSDATLRVANAQKKLLLADPALTRFYINILHPAARAMEVVEQGGVFIDLAEYDKLEAELNEEIDTLTMKAKKIMGGRIVAKHQDLSKRGGLNLTKASLLIDFMFSPMGLNLTPLMQTAKGSISTAMDHLEMFKNHPDASEFVNLLSDFSSATKTLGTYVHGFKSHIRSDGNFHPTYFLFAGGAGVGGTNCMPAGELVLTSRGYLPVEAVRTGDVVLSHTGVPRKVVSTVLNGVKPVLEVVLANGLRLKTTANHKYLIGDSWVAAGDLKVGDVATAHSGPEQWEPVAGWGDYRVSSWGRVLNVKTKNIVTQYPKGKWGHLKVTLRRNGSQERGSDLKDISVHRLVAEAFVEKFEGVEVRHLNGFAWDNTAENLEWGSALENRTDAVGHGTMSRRNGSQNKLTEEAVAFIRSQPRATKLGGWTNAQLAEKFGVCERLIRAVRAGKRWAPEASEGKRAVFKPCAIVAINCMPAAMTFGLSVEVDESHVTGGVVTHNTGRLSCKDPAFQCHSGSTPVFTEGGEQSILSVVEGYERGESFRVLTHTGAWRDVVGVYRNGVRPLLRITTSMGRAIDCTHNHPLLTPKGFVQAGRVVVGDELYGVESYEAAQRLIRPSGGILDGVEGLGCWVQGGEKEVPLPLQVRGREGSLGQCLGWPEPEQILWLLQESATHNTWTQQEGQSVQDLLGMAAHDFSVLQPERQGVRELWGAWHHGLRFVERLLRGVLERYGREAYESVLGQARGGWAVLQRQLPVGHGVGAGEESPELRVAGVQRAAEARQRLGSGVWAESGDGAGQDYSRVERDSSPYHAAQAEAAGYLREVIVSIEELPAEETFDLTIDRCHSFVANGIVVHNTIPKHTKWAKRLRKVFIAPPGMLVMENDYSQGELRVIACIANEPTMLEVYRQGLDLHVITPSKFVGFTVEEILAMEETDPDKFGAIRQMGKAGNFGLIYGMSAGGFQAYASTSYGVHLSDAESNAFRNGFFETYPALPEYHKEYKAHARTHGYVRSPLGRIRHLPLINSKNGEVRSGAERQAINSPVQGCLSDMMIWAIAEGKAKGYHTDAPCFGLVHDAGYRYIPEDNFEFYAQREKDQMENLPFEKVGWNPQLKFVTDCKVGSDMATLSKVKLK